MKSLIKIIIVIIIAIILVSSIYIIFFSEENNDNNHNNDNGNNDEIDDEAPTIDFITGDTSVRSGESVKIEVSFSDNVAVTEAKIFYKQLGGVLKSGDILSGSYRINIPLDSDTDWYYYVTIDDAAGNGPVGEPSNDGSKFYKITVINNNNDGNNSDKHIVFIEESTATNCHYCIYVAKMLYNLYNPDNPDFYYVSLVEDENNKAKNRVVNELNRYANPTVYIDGGYKTILGFNPNKKDEYEVELNQSIKSAVNRDVPQIIVKLDAKWNDSRSELTTQVSIENKDSFMYTGRLKVYIAEIQSRWIDYAGDPFHFAFIDYSINKDISLGSGENKSLSEIWNASKAGFGDIYPENIQVFAVIFNSEKNQGYAQPPDDNPFDAYYADATASAKIRNGTLPPTIGITVPKEHHRYIFNKIDMQTLITKRTVLIGRGTIRASVIADAGVKQVEFYIDGNLVYNSTEEPYRYSFRKIGATKRLFFNSKHTFEVKIIDKEDRVATDSIEVLTYFL